MNPYSFSHLKEGKASKDGHKKRYRDSNDGNHQWSCVKSGLLQESSLGTSTCSSGVSPGLDNEVQARQVDFADQRKRDSESFSLRDSNLETDHRPSKSDKTFRKTEISRNFSSSLTNSQRVSFSAGSSCRGGQKDYSERHQDSLKKDKMPGGGAAANGSYSSSLEEYIRDLLNSIIPTTEELNDRRYVIQTIMWILKPLGLTVKVYGSLTTGLMISSSDIDMVMVPVEEPHLQPLLAQFEEARKMIDAVTMCTNEYPTPMQKAKIISCIRTVGKTFHRCGAQLRRIITITRARVPIVKCEAAAGHNRVRVDLTFDRSGLTTSAFLCRSFLKPGNEYARALTTLVKVLLASAFLNDPSVGGLGSFPTAIMVLFFVEVHVKKYVPLELRGDIGVLLGSFLKFFGDEFDFRVNGIDYIGGKTFLKPPTNVLFVTNPISPGTNCAVAATLFEKKIRPFFSSAAGIVCPLISSRYQKGEVDVKLQGLFSAATTSTCHRRKDSFFPFYRKSGESDLGAKISQKANVWDKDGIYCGAFF